MVVRVEEEVRLVSIVEKIRSTTTMETATDVMTRQCSNLEISNLVQKEFSKVDSADKGKDVADMGRSYFNLKLKNCQKYSIFHFYLTKYVLFIIYSI